MLPCGVRLALRVVLRCGRRSRGSAHDPMGKAIRSIGSAKWVEWVDLWVNVRVWVRETIYMEPRSSACHILLVLSPRCGGDGSSGCCYNCCEGAKGHPTGSDGGAAGCRARAMPGAGVSLRLIPRHHTPCSPSGTVTEALQRERAFRLPLVTS